MSDDIVRRLRGHGWDLPLFDDAADEIERLRTLCRDLLDEEMLTKHGLYETEIRRMQNETDSLRAKVLSLTANVEDLG